MHSLPNAPPHHCAVGPFQSLSWDIFPKSFRKWAHMSTRKTNLVFATVWFVYWSRKEMRFLCKKVFQQDPSSGWANTTETDYKQAEGPTPGPGPCLTALLLTSTFLFFPAFSLMHLHTEAFQYSLREPKNHSHTVGLVLIPTSIGSTKRPGKGLKLGCWGPMV